jgi:trigger factor
VIDALLEKVDPEMPPTLVRRASRREQTRSLVRMLRAGVARDEAERLAADTADRTREAVERRLKADHVLRKIAERERIVVTESEVDSQIRGFASSQGWREERARSYLEERGMVASLRRDMRQSKTMEFLLEHAEIEEVPPEEYQQRHRDRLAAEEQ